MIRIAHLVDDTNPGGVTRYLDFIRTDPGLAGLAQHEIVPVPRNAPGSVPVEADVIVSHLTITWRGLPGLMALRSRHSTRRLIHVEHSYSEGFVAGNVMSRGRFGTLLRCAYALFDTVVAVSRSQADWLNRRGHVDAARLEFIPPCVDLDPFAALPPREGPVRTIGALGRLDRQKGFDVLVAAFREVTRADLRLLAIGDGPERARLEALADGDPRITFTGFAASPAEALAACDAVAMPSRWEPYGLVALEAATAGRPLLAARADGLAARAGAACLAVPELTRDAWADAIRRLAETEGGVRPCRRSIREAAEAATREGWRRVLKEVNADAAGAKAA